MKRMQKKDIYILLVAFSTVHLSPIPQIGIFLAIKHLFDVTLRFHVIYIFNIFFTLTHFYTQKEIWNIKVYACIPKPNSDFHFTNFFLGSSSI